MKVLLISPIDPDKPGELKYLVGGENTYTKSLLQNPPDGVTYIHHVDALKKGSVSYSLWQKPLSLLGILSPDAGIQSFILNDNFDLIHCHGYCFHTTNYHGPVVLSDSSSNLLFLRGYLGWSSLRIKAAYAMRKMIDKLLGIYDPNLNLKEAPLIVWSNFAGKLHQELGIGEDKITVIPPGIAKNSAKKKRNKNFNLLFVGIWFKRKGGDLLIKAYQQLKRKYPHLALTIIGQIPKNIFLPKDVWHKNYLPREKLLKEVLPDTDLLILIPPETEGYGMVAVEAFSFGIPAIVTKIGALPEIVENNKSGFIIKSRDLNDLKNKITLLLENKGLLKKMGKRAYQRWQDKFDIAKTNQQLLSIYQRALFLKSE